MDVVGATVLLVLTAPILAVAALGIAVLQGGPVIHRRRVLGLGGRPFDAFKLRSMRVDADQILHRDSALRQMVHHARWLEMRLGYSEDQRGGSGRLAFAAGRAVLNRYATLFAVISRRGR